MRFVGWCGGVVAGAFMGFNVFARIDGVCQLKGRERRELRFCLQSFLLFRVGISLFMV